MSLARFVDRIESIKEKLGDEKKLITDGTPDWG
jgi:hypothetical protein